MPFHQIGALIITCALAASSLHADTSLVVTLPSVADRVRAQNPDLAAARLRIREAQGRMKQAGRLENPQLESSFQHNPAFNEGALEIGISQRFPLTNRLQLEKEISLTEIQAAEMEVKSAERRLSAEASASLIEVLAIRQHRDLLGEQTRLAAELAETLRQTAEKGEASPLDAGQARMEAMRAATEMRQLDATEAAAAGKLKPLLGMRAEETLIVSGVLPEAKLPAAVDPNRRPDFIAAKLNARAAAGQVALEQARRTDDAEAGVFTGIERTEDEPNGRSNDGIIGIRFKLALPFWNQNEGKIEEAQAAHNRKQLEAVALGRAIELEAEAALAEMRQWAALAEEITGQLLPLAADQLEKTTAAYQAGQTDLQSVLRARDQRFQLAISRLDALRQFHLARVRHPNFR